MIIVKLLGGAKKIIGRDKVFLEERSMSVKQILQILQKLSNNYDALDLRNMLIAVNGTELSLLGGLDAEVNDGDVVSMVPVVHGGTVEM
jgi:molybdopterin converting factor small subunit